MRHADIVTAFLTAKADALARRDAAFFERVLHPDFVYVNTRGKRLSKAEYLSQFTNSGPVKIVWQVIRDLETIRFGPIAVATMTVDDRFDDAGKQSDFTFRSLCVFRIDGAACRWVAGQTMVAQGGG